MNQSLQQHIPALQNLLSSFQPEQFLQKLSQDFDKRVVFSSSFSFEDQVITHMIAHQQLPIQIFTLDTGRLFV